MAINLDAASEAVTVSGPIDSAVLPALGVAGRDTKSGTVVEANATSGLGRLIGVAGAFALTLADSDSLIRIGTGLAKTLAGGMTADLTHRKAVSTSAKGSAFGNQAATVELVWAINAPLATANAASGVGIGQALGLLSGQNKAALDAFGHQRPDHRHQGSGRCGLDPIAGADDFGHFGHDRPAQRRRPDADQRLGYFGAQPRAGDDRGRLGGFGNVVRADKP